jgi:hypothetical protein
VAAPPFDLGKIFGELKRLYGGGSFELRIRAGGRIRGTVPIYIAKELAAPAAPPAAATGGMGEIMTLMMTQQQAAADRQMDMMLAMNKSQTDLMAAIFTGNRGGGEKISDTVALIAALQPKGGGVKETLETFAAFKALTDGTGGGDKGGGEFDAEDLLGSAGRLAGPVMRGLADFLQRRGIGPGGGAGEGADFSANGAHPPSGGGPLALEATPSRFRVIELVKIDVVYGYERGHDPGKVADLVYDVIEANNVTEAEINELATTFALSPTGLEDLAAEGVDLRERPQWAHDFFATLAEIHASVHSEEAEDSERPGGGAANAAGNGAAKPRRAA